MRADSRHARAWSVLFGYGSFVYARCLTRATCVGRSSRQEEEEARDHSVFAGRHESTALVCRSDSNSTGINKLLLDVRLFSDSEEAGVLLLPGERNIFEKCLADAFFLIYHSRILRLTIAVPRIPEVAVANGSNTVRNPFQYGRQVRQRGSRN